MSGTAGDAGNGNDLLERDDLNSRDDENHVDVAHEEPAEKDSNHDEGPKCPSDEVLLLLVVLGRLLLFWGLVLLQVSI